VRSRIFSSLLFSAVAALNLIAAAQLAQADDVGVSVNVVSASNAPTPRTDLANSLGIRADNAEVKVTVEGLEPGRDVSFTVTPVVTPLLEVKSDVSGNVHSSLHLPYGLLAGEHSIMATAPFGADDTKAVYEIGKIYVSDLGVLTDALGHFPLHTVPSVTLPRTSLKIIQVPPKFVEATGVFDVSEAVIRVSSDLNPAVLAQITFRNATNSSQDLAAEVWLADAFGNKVSKVFYTPLNGMEPSSTSVGQYKFDGSFYAGFYSVQTKLVIPGTFTSDSPVRTTFDSQIFVLPKTLMVLLLAALGILGLIFITVRQLRQETHEVSS